MERRMKRWWALAVCLPVLLFAVGCATRPNEEPTTLPTAATVPPEAATGPETVPVEPTLPPETTPPTEAVIPEEEPQLKSGWYAVREESLDALTTGILRIWIRLDEDGTGELRINSDSFALKWDGSSLKMTHENLDMGDQLIKMHYSELLIHGTPRAGGLTLYLMRSRLIFDHAGEALPEEYLEPPVEPGLYGYVDHTWWSEENEQIVYGHPLEDGDVEQGWLELKEDGTGTLSYGGVTRDFTWEGDYLYTDDEAIQAQAWMELLYNDYAGSLRAGNEPGIKLKLEAEETFLYLRRIPDE